MKFLNTVGDSVKKVFLILISSAQVFAACKAGFVETEDGECFRPFRCDKGQYAIDSVECEILPENAVRNKEIGFSCKAGFYADESSDTCKKLPANALADSSEEDGFACKSGFVKKSGACLKE